MDREEARQEVKARIPVTNYLTKSPKGNYCCPFCGSGTGEHKTGAVKVYPETNSFYCHACGKSGDVIDLYQQQTGADYNTALSLLAAEAGVTIDSRPEAAAAPATRPAASVPAAGPAEKPPADYTEYYRACRERITDPRAAAYLEARGITEETARAYWLGFDPEADPAGAGHPAPRLILPTNKAHYVARSIDPDTAPAFAKMNVKGSTPGIFNKAALYAQDAQQVFVTEGIFDALSIIEAGAAAVATNSAANVKKLAAELAEKPTAATLIICLDNDPDAQTRAKIEADKKELEKGLMAAGIRYIEADINGVYKDPNEYLQKDRAGFIEAVKTAQAAAVPKSEIDSFLEVIYTEKYKPVSTGISGLDKLLHGGFIPQTLILLGAPPATGKTALATMIFESMAEAGHPGIYFNLEMSREQILARSIARIAYTNNNWPLDVLDVLQGYRQDAQTREVVEGAARMYEKKTGGLLQYNPDNIGSGATQILEYIEAEAKRAVAAGRPAPNVCIDYLHILTADPREDHDEMIKRVAMGLKSYAKRYNTIVLAIMAQGRAVNSLKEATMQAGRDTSGLEYTADLQLQLIRKDEENKPNEITLHVTKSRFTQAVMSYGLPFTFHGGQSYFEEGSDWETTTEETPFDTPPAKKTRGRKGKKSEQVTGQQDLPF